MNFISKMDGSIKHLSDLIEKKATENSDFYPINRDVIEPYIYQILQLDRNEFLIYNIEQKSNLYSTYLMLSLPELWQDITVEDLIHIINSFRNVFAFYGIISFIYKFVEIDSIALVLKLTEVQPVFKDEIILFIKRQYSTFLKTETDYLFFDQGLIGVSIDEWLYIKQRLLTDNRISAALTNLNALKRYVTSLFSNSPTI